MAVDRVASRLQVAILAPLLLMGGCAGSTRYGALDSTESWCAGQYREHRDLAPSPTGLSDKERGRYEERTRDYHVSQGCQRDAARSVRHEIPDVPRSRVQ